MSAQPPTPPTSVVPAGVVLSVGQTMGQPATSAPGGTGPDVVTTLSRTASELPAPGVVTAAPVAPKTGSIDVPAGSPVVVVAQHFWDSPTIKAARNLVLGAVGAGLFAVALKIVGAGSVIGLDWIEVRNIAINATVLALAAGFMAWWKVRDNNPTVK